MFNLPSAPGLYIEIGLVLGTLHTAWTGWACFYLGRRLGVRTAHAAHTMHQAQVVMAESGRPPAALGEEPTALLPGGAAMYRGGRSPWSTRPKRSAG